ncbi:MAG TPA: tail fiber protein [Pyrinomonadaceae bacterium]
MPEPYVGEIRMFAGNFPPVGWLFCEGQQLSISENEVLFQLIGTTYGGDGQETFNLPNLQSRIPMHFGAGPDGITYPLAQMAGTEQETLTVQQIPNHTHAWLASNANANTKNPVGGVPGIVQGDFYTTSISPIGMSAQSITPAGGSQPHENTQPFLCINYIISLFGIFPSPS